MMLMLALMLMLIVLILKLILSLLYIKRIINIDIKLKIDYRNGKSNFILKICLVHLNY